MSEENDTLEINVHIPKSGIFFLGNCIRYAWNMCHRYDELLPPEKALLEGRINIECVVKSLYRLSVDEEDLLENQDGFEDQEDKADEPEVEGNHAEILETQVEELEAEVEELEAQNERLIDLIEDLYRQLEMAPALETGIDRLPSDMSEDDIPY